MPPAIFGGFGDNRRGGQGMIDAAPSVDNSAHFGRNKIDADNNIGFTRNVNNRIDASKNVNVRKPNNIDASKNVNVHRPNNIDTYPSNCQCAQARQH